MTGVARVAALSALAGLFGCGGAKKAKAPNPQVSASIGPSGGSLVLSGGPAITVPAGALEVAADLSIEEIGTAPSGNPLYSFGPSGQTFASPVTVVFPKPGGFTSGSVYWTDPGTTSRYGVLPVTLTGAGVGVQVTHFSLGFVGPLCAPGSPCTPSNPCHHGTTTCDGAPGCSDAGTSVADGEVCGSHGVCSAGVCSSAGGTAGPIVPITWPMPGATVSGPAVVKVDNMYMNADLQYRGVAILATSITLKVDGNTHASCPVGTLPYTCNWDSTAVADGNHALTVYFTGTSNGLEVSGRSSDVLVAVDNSPPSRSWQVVPISVGGLHAVWGSGPGDVWAVGDWGWILHWDGATWSRFAHPDLASGGLLSVWGSGPGDVWAFGTDGTSSKAVHWDGTAWSLAVNLAPGMIYDSWGFGPDDVWVVGDKFIKHWNGSAWSSVPIAGSLRLRGVWGSASSDLWAVGGGPGSMDCAYLHWNGSVWSSTTISASQLPHPVCLGNLWGSGPQDVWALDIGMWRWNGADWSYIATPPNYPWDISGSGPSDVWAVGPYGMIVHWNGSTWSSIASGTTANLEKVWVTGPDDAWAVGWGAILHYGPK